MLHISAATRKLPGSNQPVTHCHDPLRKYHFNLRYYCGSIWFSWKELKSSRRVAIIKLNLRASHLQATATLLVLAFSILFIGNKFSIHNIFLFPPSLPKRKNCLGKKSKRESRISARENSEFSKSRRNSCRAAAPVNRNKFSPGKAVTFSQPCTLMNRFSCPIR